MPDVAKYYSAFTFSVKQSKNRLLGRNTVYYTGKSDKGNVGSKPIGVTVIRNWRDLDILAGMGVGLSCMEGCRVAVSCKKLALKAKRHMKEVSTGINTGCIL